MSHILGRISGNYERSMLITPLPDPHSAPVTLAKLQTPVKASFETVNSDLKEVYKGLGNYSKALDKVGLFPGL